MSLKYESILRQMTLEEKASMMSGKNVWETMNFEKYHIPSIKMSDGPHGLRTQDPKDGDHLGLNGSLPSTCFPTAATIANSWDEDLGEQIGKALAKEAITLGVQVILGPGLNIKRSPLCGRNFEYFSEDPYLSGKMAASYIKGIQSLGIAACPKHFAVNNQELRRMVSNSIVDKRTLREIYTTGFEIAVKEGKPKSIMTSYNLINGTYANENKYLLKDILVDEWGFEGYVVSDWGGSNNHALGVKYGSHLEMPGTGKAGVRDIIHAIEDGVLSIQELDQRIDELLDVVFALNQSQQQIIDFDIEEHHQLARKAASEGIVLLKNENNILPLKKHTKVVVIGDFAKNPRYQGAGSSLVHPTKTPESVLENIQNVDLEMISYAKGYRRNEGSDSTLIDEALKVSKNAEVILVFAGLDEINEAEGMDRQHMKMPEAQEMLIETLANHYDNVVVVLSSGSAIEMPWASKVKAIVHGYLGGQAGSLAMLDVLTGKVNPSGKLNETYPICYEDTPAYRYYPGKKRNSEYREGLFVGYRYYSTVNQEVAFPFGFGLSYTTFEYSNLQTTSKEVSFTIKNTGDRDGTEIAQLYIGKASDTVFRPIKELKGFQRVFLKANEEKQVSIVLDDKALRYYDIQTDTWEIEDGVYHLMIGTNVNDILLETDIMIDGTVKQGPYHKEKIPSYFRGDITQVLDDEFEMLYENNIPDDSWDKEIGLNDTFGQFYYAKSRLARLTHHFLKKSMDKKIKKGDPNINEMFVYHMPLRAISKYAKGIANIKMVEGFVEIVNGHFFRGMYHFIRDYFKY